MKTIFLIRLNRNTHIGTYHLFFSGIIHTIALDVENYNHLTEYDLIGEIVNLDVINEKPLDHIKRRFSEYFNSHLEYICLYRNYCRMKKTFDVKFKLHMNKYNSVPSFTPLNSTSFSTLTSHSKTLLISLNRKERKA
jgi:hypothetical protein